MALTKRSTSHPGTWALLAATALAGTGLADQADAQARSVSMKNAWRASEVLIGSWSGSTYDEHARRMDIGTADGPWSARISRSVASPLDPWSRSIAQVDHYSMIDEDQLICFVDTDHQSNFHDTAAISYIELEFDVDGYVDLDLTSGYGSSGETVLERACDLAGLDYHHGSVVECSIWGEQAYRVDSGGLEFSGPLDIPSHPWNRLVIGRGAWDGDWFDYFDEQLEESPNWNEFKEHRRLEAGHHTLWATFGSYAEAVSPYRSSNAGGTSSWLKIDWYEVGPGSANATHGSEVTRACTANADGAASQSESNGEDVGILEASSRSSRVHATASERLRAMDTGCWGRHEVSVDVLSHVGPRTSDSTAESISEIDFTIYDDAEAHVVIEGLFERANRFTRVDCEIEIIRASGTVAWSDAITSGIRIGSRRAGSENRVTLAAGWYTLRVTTSATSRRIFSAGDVSADVSFAVIIHDRP